MTTNIFTLREVARYLKVTERTIYRLVSQRQIPGFKVGGSWRFRQGDLDEWIRRQVRHTGPHRSLTGVSSGARKTAGVER